MALKIGEPYDLHELLLKAKTGDPEAMFDAAMAIFLGKKSNDESNDRLIALRNRYLKRLVHTSGYENILITIGDIYEQGDGVEQNTNEAIKWYKKAAQAGISLGYECIGSIYFFGRGIQRDYQKSFEYIMKAGNDLSFCSLYILGEMYRRGLYVQRNDKMAFLYYNRIVGSTDGYVELDDYYWQACYRAAVAKHYGIGTEKDLDEASRLIAISKRLFDERTTKE